MARFFNMGGIDGVQTVFFRSHSSRRPRFDTIKFFRTSVIEVRWFSDLHFRQASYLSGSRLLLTTEILI